MIKQYTCPVCKGLQRIIVDPKTSKPLKTTRCAFNGCPSHKAITPSTSDEYINNVCDKYNELVGTYHNLGADGSELAGEVVVDVQYDGSVIMVDRVEYLPIRLTAKQFDIYVQQAERLDTVNLSCD